MPSSVCSTQHSPAISATKYCENCGTWMCGECASCHTKIYTDHSLLQSYDYSLEALSCEVHKKIKNQFCETCDHLICDGCISKHRKHLIKTQSEFMKIKRQKVDDLKKRGEEKLKALLNQEKLIQIKLSKLQNQQSSIRDVRSNIERRTQELVSMTKYVHQYKTAGYQEHCKGLEKLIKPFDSSDEPSTSTDEINRKRENDSQQRGKATEQKRKQSRK